MLRALFDFSQEILSTYTAVGIAEEWNVSMQLFDATIKSPVGQWQSSDMINPGLHSPERQELLEWAHSSPEVHNMLAVDLLLYHFAVEVFEKQTREVLGIHWDKWTRKL